MRTSSGMIIYVASLASMSVLTAVWGQSPDPYSLKPVSAIKELYGRFSTGWDEKEVPRLGDKGSIALIKLSSLDSWNDPDEVQKALGMMRDFFSHPEFIENPSDKHPRVTLLLLSWLRCNHNESEILKEIDRTAQYIEEQTKSK